MARAAIPMEGSADSLNASVAAAVLVFEAQRQHRHADRTPAAGTD
jgi:tRNA G18 (ribose-2'-O)-methylase SpoU